MVRRAAAALLAVLACAVGPGAHAQDGEDAHHVWVEGESPTRGKGHPHDWYSGEVDARQLSGGAFLSSFGADTDTEVEYDVEIPAKGTYRLWVRANPIQSVLEWRVGDRAWQSANTWEAVDRVNVASDGKPDMRYLGWMDLGQVHAAKGTLRVGFAFRSPNQHHGALDCFLLTTGDFHPNGRRRPGMPLTDSEKGWFAFDPGPDPFRDDALLDLRPLNEARAGQSGPLRREGDDIVLGNGTPVRFWGVNHGRIGSPADTDRLARRLAKTGFNLVRIHGKIHARRGPEPRPVAPGKVAAIQHAVDAFADQGMYSALSVWFPLWYDLSADDGVEGGRVGAHPFALLFVEPSIRELWKTTVTELLTADNPVTGVPLAEDPAVGFFEIQNEDSLLFWTASEKTLGPGPWARLERLFAAWVAKEHGDARTALARWDGAEHDHDAEDGGRLGVFEPWHLTRNGLRDASPGLRRRLGDQLRFLADLQRDTYAELAQHVRDLGFRGLIVPSNWQTADDSALLAVERWTYTVGDVVDRHGYFAGKHEGEAASYSVRRGHAFTDRSALREPWAARIGMVQIAGRPHIHSEVAWSRPNRLRAEAPLLLAAYGALQGTDGWVQFAARAPDWNTDPTAKWPMQVPAAIGQSPAAALLFRRGDVQPGPVVARIDRSLQRLFAPGSGGMVEGGSADFRATEDGDPGSAAFDPLLHYVGRVEMRIEGVSPEGGAPVTDAPGIDREARRVTSATGELALDWGGGLLTVDTPRSQAVTGFLGAAGEVELSDVAIRCRNEYGAVHVVSLDGAPLATSRRVLVQAFTREQPFGFRAEDGVITNLGCAPLNVEEIDAEVRLPAGAWKAVRLDANGYAAAPVPVERGRLVLPRDALYVLLTR